MAASLKRSRAKINNLYIRKSIPPKANLQTARKGNFA
jgi:hypothetical protein